MQSQHGHPGVGKWAIGCAVVVRFVLTATCFSALLFCIIDEAIVNCFAEFPKVTVFDFRTWWAIEENVADSRLDKLY